MNKNNPHNLLSQRRLGSIGLQGNTPDNVMRSGIKKNYFKKKWILAAAKMTILSIWINIPNTAFAASCYTPTQFRAEQVVRLQTQLMMTSLLCPSAVAGVPSAYSAYQQFVRRHQTFLSGQENQLLGFYRAQHVPQPDRQLHTFKTNMANRLATFAANRQPGVFCRTYGSRLQQAVKLTPAALQIWGKQIALNRPSAYPVCVMGAVKK